jgi:ABC-type antimicrobial peptide transport system permease subunit
MFWVVRTIGDPLAIAPAFVRELRRVNPDVVASQLRPFDTYVRDSMAPRRFSVLLMTMFAVAALLLAVTGIYAVAASSLAQRSREIGIRVALGARPANIVRLVIAEGARFILGGLGLGIAIAVGLLRTMSTMLFGLPAGDPATIAQVSAVVSVAALLACAMPTVRALTIAGAGFDAK